MTKAHLFQASNRVSNIIILKTYHNESNPLYHHAIHSSHLYSYVHIRVNDNDLTATSLGIMVNAGNHPQMAFFQVSEILYFTHIYIYVYIYIHICIYIYIYIHITCTCFSALTSSPDVNSSVRGSGEFHLATLDDPQRPSGYRHCALETSKGPWAHGPMGWGGGP